MSMEKGAKTPAGKGGAEKRARRERPAKGGEQPVKISDFVLAMHRLNNATADADVFSNNGVTIAEWALLKEMNGKSEMSLADVNKAARVSRQRLRTLLSDLDGKGFIKSAKAETGEGDQRTRTITILPKTAQTVAAVEKDFDTLGEKVAPLGMAAANKRLGGWTRTMGKLASALRRTEVAAAKTPEGKAASAEKRAEAKKKREERLRKKQSKPVKPAK